MVTKLFASTDKDVIVDACWAVSYMSGNKGGILACQGVEGLTESLVQYLLNSESSSIIRPALRAIGNFVTTDEASLTQKCLDANFISAFPRLLNHSEKMIRKEAVWALSNIAAGTTKQVQAIISHNDAKYGATGASIIQTIVGFAKNEEYKIRKVR